MAPSFPRPFGKYSLLRPLEEGTSGDIFLAHSDALGASELCVIKHLGPKDDPTTTSEFERARRALTLEHECLVSVIDIGHEAGVSFMVMEYVEGRDLRDIANTCEARDVALPLEAGIYIGLQLCRGARALHDAGADDRSRRLFSPPNILVSFDGDVKIAMAKTHAPDTSTIIKGKYAGLAYLSPEELDGRPRTPHSDIYSIGVILWDLLVGRPIHTGITDRKAALEAALQAAIPHPSAYNPDLSDDLDAIIMRALAAAPEDRHANIEELRDDIATALANRDPSFDGAAMTDLLRDIYGDDQVIYARRASRKLLLDAEHLTHANNPPDPAPLSQKTPGNTQGTLDTEPHLDAIDDLPALGQDNLAGQTISDRYQIIERIGEGGMGAVYLAEHKDLGRQVAIKILHAAYSNDPELVKRFRQEARAAAEIGHPNIIEVTDFGTTTDGRIYFVMEYLAGEDLAQVMAKTRRLPTVRSLEIALQICEALHAAHEAGIVHRDLKPENIFLLEKDGKRDFVKVLDFGVAINLEMIRRGDARLTTPGIAMGTPEYMAPEQAAGQSIDRRIDVYATAVMVYEMVTGRLPHEGPTLMALLNKKATEEPTKPSRYRPDVAGPLEDVLLRGLQRDPAARYQTMEALRDALSAALIHTTGPQGEPAAIPPVAPKASSSTIAHDPTQLAIASRPPAQTTGVIPTHAAERTNPFAATPPVETPRLRTGASSFARFLLFLVTAALIGASVWWWFHRPTQGSKRPRPHPRKPKASKPKASKPKASKPKASKPKASKPKKKKLTPAQILVNLEWARRAAAGHRYTRPRNDNVRDLLRRIDRDYPQNSKVAAFRKAFCKTRYRKAKLNLRRRHRPAAERLLRVCLAISPHHAPSQRLLAGIYLVDAKRSMKRHHDKAATRAAKAVLKVYPQSAKAREILADVAYKHHKYRTAARLYQSALAQGKLSRRVKRALRRKLRRAKRHAR